MTSPLDDPGLLARHAGVYVHRRTVPFPRGPQEIRAVYELRVDGTGRFFLRVGEGPPITVLERRDDHLTWHVAEGRIRIVSPMGDTEARVAGGDAIEIDLPSGVAIYRRE